MKKWTLLVGLILAHFITNANHVLGGEITWECQNGQYILQTVIYVDCSGLSFNQTSITINQTNGPTVNCALVGSSFISPSCYASGSAINCDSTITYTPVKRYVFRSSPFSLSSAIPVTGNHFWVSLQARPSTDNTTNGAANGYMLRASMYPYVQNGNVQPANPCYDNSPQFNERPLHAFANDSNSFYLDGFDVDNQDSISFSWAPSLNEGTSYPGSSLGYETGYFWNNPLPGNTVNAGNSNAVLDNNGYLNFNSITIGTFTTCYKIESFRNGVKIAEVFRDFQMQIEVDQGSPGLCGSSLNGNPSVNFSWVSGFDTLTPVSSNNRIIQYGMDVYAGDTVKFKIHSVDVDLNSNCTPQAITVRVDGPSMSDSLSGTNDCQNGPCAKLVSLNSNGSYTSSLSNNTRFEWITDTSHADGPFGFGNHLFIIKATDNNCIIPGQKEVQVFIKVHRPIYTSNSTLSICLGDTLEVEVKGDTANVSWSPTTGVACPTCAVTELYPVVSTTYWVTDVNSGYSTEFHVNVDLPQAQPSLVKSGADLTVPNSALYDTLFWYNTHAPITAQASVYQPYLSGDYWVAGATGSCLQYSDTISNPYQNDLNMVNSMGGAFDSLRWGERTFGFTFRLNNEPYYDVNGVYVHAYDKNALADYTSLRCKIYDALLNSVFESDSVVRIDEDVILFYGQAFLGSNKDYTLTIYADTNVVVPTYRPNVWPVIASDSRVYVFNAQTALGNTIPTSSAPYYPFANLSLTYGIGLSEIAKVNFNVYPNPATNLLNVYTDQLASYAIINAFGQTILNGSVDGHQQVELSVLPRGVYILSVTDKSGETQSRKIVLQ